jgi:CubicO group peptidase (beta-lactamase class C family)
MKIRFFEYYRCIEKYSLFLTIFLLFSIPGQCDPLDDKFDLYVDKMLHDWDAPGLMISVVKDGKPLFVKGYGTRKLGENWPVDGNTLCPIASNTKTFTVAAVAMLVDEGKLSWDDPVKKYIPEFELLDPFATYETTIRDALAHRAGLGPYLTVQNDFVHSRADVLYNIRFQEPTTAFRDKFFYSNIGYLIAGEIIERISGKKWEEFIKERIFTPLEMNSSFATIVDLRKAGNPDLMNNIFIPHKKIQGKVTVTSWDERSNLYAAAGGIVTTGNDLAKWMLLQLQEGEYNGKRLISAASMREMHKPLMVMDISWAEDVYNPLAHTVSYDLGWTSHDYRGRGVIEHLGSFMNAVVALVPDEKLGIAVCTNAAYDNLESLRMISALKLKIIDAFIGAPERDWSMEYLGIQKRILAAQTGAKKEEAIVPSQPSLKPEEYTGTYTSPRYGTIVISVENRKPVLRYRAGYAGEMEPLGGTIFRVKWRESADMRSEISFSLDGGKSIRSLNWKGFGMFAKK